MSDLTYESAKLAAKDVRTTAIQIANKANEITTELCKTHSRTRILENEACLDILKKIDEHIIDLEALRDELWEKLEDHKDAIKGESIEHLED